MNKINTFFSFLVLISILSFLGCSKNDERTGQLIRNISQDDIDSIKYATIDGYDVGWTTLTFSSYYPICSMPIYTGCDGECLSFFIDQIEDGTYRCKDTKSFKRYANFKCNDVDYTPNDVIKITKNLEDNYTISFSYEENGQSFRGTYTGVVNRRSWPIDFHPDCY